MSVINRIRAAAAGRVADQVQGIVKAQIPGAMGSVLSGAAVRAIAEGPRALKAAIPSKKALLDVGLGELARRQTQAVAAAKGRIEEQFRRQVAGRLPAGLPAPSAIPTPIAKPSIPGGAEWTPAPVFGGLTLDRYRQLFVESAMTAREWKNLFHVSIAETKASKEVPEGAAALNLLAIDASFNPATMTGDADPLGSANLDSLAATERVELRLTTFDDDRGTLKRWFIGKADQTAHVDGTFGLPAEYLLVVSLVHMDVTGEASPRQRMQQRWLMRPASIEIELSRRAPELTELQMTFVQFDSFMQAP